ncbi:MAG TPA: glycosyltransferase family 2 protein [Rhizomicrobium sp.]|jgi:glycosyltransferase involved in cell wall biosynthesis|nr:glycosyltransferase family 2 protein [Rhizomicrobium sp.]
MNEEIRLLSVVVPVFDEEAVIDEFNRRMLATLGGLPFPAELIYINDGSRDRTPEIIRGYLRNFENVALIDLSRNFGKEAAMTAGIDHAGGDAVAIIDADLQDPPELIPELLRVLQDGDYDVVYAQRTSRSGETYAKKTSAHLFYRVMRKLTGIDIPHDTGDFRLMNRRAVEALRRLREHHRFMKGLFAWIGFRQVALRYDRDARFAGESKFNYWRLWNFSLEGITSFTTAPLKVAAYVGLLTSVIAALYGLAIIISTLVLGNPVPGYPSLLVVVLFLGGLQLLTLGIMGEYLGRVFNESKRRPLYFVREHLRSQRRTETVPVEAGAAVQPKQDMPAH